MMREIAGRLSVGNITGWEGRRMQWHKMATRWQKSPTVLFVKLDEGSVASFF